MTCKYLREVSKKFEKTPLLFSGAWGKMIHEKKPEAKNLMTLQFVPLTILRPRKFCLYKPIGCKEFFPWTSYKLIKKPESASHFFQCNMTRSSASLQCYRGPARVHFSSQPRQQMSLSWDFVYVVKK
jgi:hypothetical protein